MAERSRGAHRDEETEAEKARAEDAEAPQSSSGADEEPTKEDATAPDEVADRIIVDNHDDDANLVERLTTDAPRVTRKK